LWNPNNYNLVIDTSERTPEEVLDIILNEFKDYKRKKWIAETDEEKKELRKANKKKKLLRDIALLIALMLMIFWRLFTIMNEHKEAELRENSGTIDNNDIEKVIENLE